jgi:hypothetical protein
MKTYIILVFFAVYGGEPDTRSSLMDSVQECHERGISAMLYARERDDIESPHFMCVRVRTREPGQPI